MQGAFKGKDGRYRIDKVYRGQRIRKQTEATTQAAAEKELLTEMQRIDKALDDPAFAKGMRKPFLDAVHQTYKEVWANRSDGNTVKYRMEMVAEIIGPQTPIARITGNTVVKVREALAKDPDLSKQTVNHYMTHFRQILLRARNVWGELQTIPKVEKFNIPRKKKKFVFSDEHKKLMFDYLYVGYAASAAAELTRPNNNPRRMGPVVGDMLAFALETGCRLSEMTQLDTRLYDVVNLEEGYLHLDPTQMKVKWHIERTIPLTPAAIGILQRRIEEVGPMPFAVDRSTVCKLMKKAREVLGLPDEVGMHTARHTWITDMARIPENDLETVRDLAGHRNIETTQLYLHTDEDRKREAIMRLHSRTNPTKHSHIRAVK